MNEQQEVVGSYSDPIYVGDPSPSTLESIEQTNLILDQVVDTRMNQWEKAINAELQDLVTEASHLRQQITSSKTTTKKKYYQKKFDKVSIQVRQMLIALQRVKAQDTTPKSTFNNQNSDASSTATI